MADHSGGGTNAREFGDRVDMLGWGLLFVAIGAVTILPATPEGAWLVAAGLVMLGMSAARARLRLPVWGVTVFVGIAALAAGIFSIAGFGTWVGPLVLLVLGAKLILGALVRTPQWTDRTPQAQNR